jgi:hypothetical protein
VIQNMPVSFPPDDLLLSFDDLIVASLTFFHLCFHDFVFKGYRAQTNNASSRKVGYKTMLNDCCHILLIMSRITY